MKTPAQPLDIATHWLGQRRDFGERGDGPLVDVRGLRMRFVLKNAFLKRNQRTLDAVRTSASPSARARSSAWWANPVRASPRSRG